MYFSGGVVIVDLPRQGASAEPKDGQRQRHRVKRCREHRHANHSDLPFCRKTTKAINYT